MQETCIHVAYRTIQVSDTWNMSDDWDGYLAEAATIVLSALNDKIIKQ